MFFLCLKVFLARITDVTLGTIRTMFTVKSKRLVASLIGFIEVLIWFLVVREALSTDDKSIYIAISYALGFATGTYIGGFLAGKLIRGKIAIQVFTENIVLADILRDAGYAVTIIDCNGYNTTAKYMLYIGVDKKKEHEVRQIVEQVDAKAFIVENETNYVENGYFKK